MSKFRRGTASKARSKATSSKRAIRKTGAARGGRVPKRVPAVAARPAGPLGAPPAAKAKAAPGTAAVLAIGDEILRGESANSNAAYLSDRLFDAGYEVRAH